MLQALEAVLITYALAVGISVPGLLLLALVEWLAQTRKGEHAASGAQKEGRR